MPKGETRASRPEMGAVPLKEGVVFRVWAPHADAVHVTGRFNGWSRTAHPLSRDEGGCWSAVVPEARAGDAYRFVIEKGDQVLERLDPYARLVCKQENCAVVYDPGTEPVPCGFTLPP